MCVLLLTLPIKTEDPNVRLPIVGVSRHLCGTCASFLRNSFATFGTKEATLDRLVPETQRAYSTCCMPHGAGPAVVEKVAAELDDELGWAFTEPNVLDFFHALAISVGGKPSPSPDPRDLDSARDRPVMSEGSDCFDVCQLS